MSFLRPSKWFRQPVMKDAQSGWETIDSKMIASCRAEDENDGFTCVDIRPMTYAEAACSVYPAVNARIDTTEYYSSIDEPKLAVEMVEEYEARAKAASKSPLSTHVLANIEMCSDSFHETRTRSRSRTRQRSKRSKR